MKPIDPNRSAAKEVCMGIVLGIVVGFCLWAGFLVLFASIF